MVQFLCFICSRGVFTGVSEHWSVVVKADERFAKSDYCKTPKHDLTCNTHLLGTERSPIQSESLPAGEPSVKNRKGIKYNHQQDKNKIIEETIYCNYL